MLSYPNLPAPLPPLLGEILTDSITLRGVFIPSNWDICHGALSYAQRRGDIGREAAAHLRAWLSVNEDYTRGRTYDSLTEGEKATIQRISREFKGE